MPRYRVTLEYRDGAKNHTITKIVEATTEADAISVAKARMAEEDRAVNGLDCWCHSVEPLAQ